MTVPQRQKDPAAVRRGRIGGLTRAATAPTPQDITKAACDSRTARYRAQVLEANPGLTDEADIGRRMDLLLRADMVRLSGLAAEKRRAKARASGGTRPSRTSTAVTVS